MHDILFHYQKIHPMNWVYLSSLLTIALYFKFSRFWSVRNIDMIGLLLLAPGLAHAVKVGKLAPGFNLRATTDTDISLSQFRGVQMVLIEFYHEDFTPASITNLSTRRDDHEKFLELGIKVLGIAIAHKFSQKTFAESLKLPYPLLSDYPHGRTILAYDVGQLEGKAKRLYARQGFFLIDKQGIVRGRWVVRPPKPGEVNAPDKLFGNEQILKRAREIAGRG